MPSSYPGPATGRRFDRWEWVAGVAAGALVLWIGSCSFCSGSDDLVRKGPGLAEAPSRQTRDSADAEIASLRTALNREIEAREQLAWEVASLREQLGSGAQRGSVANRPAAAPERGAQRSMFDRDSLVAAGMAAADAQELRSRWESTELEKIRLIDRATREGWLGSARYQEELRGLETRLRGDLDDVDYDRYLYATGRNNRARVTDVLANSPGEAAGFRPGDTVLSYDGKRVFSIEELRDLATRSRPGDTIRVEVLQDGEVETLTVPGGPIGLMMKPEHQPPR